METIKIVAYRLGENISIKNFREMCKGDACSISATEIFIKKGEGSYIYVQNYGEVAFSGCSDEVIAEFLRLVAPHVETPVALGKEYKEDFIIQVNPGQKLKFGYNSIQVPELNADVIKIAMLNVSQSVVLDHFTELSQALLHQTSKYSRELELKGKIKTSKTRLMKFMGKALNIQNRITDNLYFLDAPDTVWENEYLSQINNGLSATFHLKTRFREVEYTLKIIDNNLVIFSQLVQHRDANKLEWIIILLIFFELAHALLSKYL